MMLRNLSRRAPRAVTQLPSSLARNYSNAAEILADLGLSEKNLGVYNDKGWSGRGSESTSYNPATGEAIATVVGGTEEDYEDCITAMNAVKRDWGLVPAPMRGEVVRKIGVRLREKKAALGALISLENGKIRVEGEGEVQEAIDMCDFAVGLSRMLNGTIIPSERPGHTIMEMYNPLKGHVGIITAFNFPCAVAFWNTCLSLVCGNTQIWKGASTVNLVSIACQKIIHEVLEEEGYPAGIATMISGKGSLIGSKLAPDPRIELVSFTGSTNIGFGVGATVGGRFGKSILELGGNNSMIVMEDADQEMALTAAIFGAVGTAGQRCTTLRRLYLQRSVHDAFLERLLKMYKGVKIGNPLDEGVLMGPLITEAAVKDYVEGLDVIRNTDAKILCGGNVLDGPGHYVEPTVVSCSHYEPFVQDELFAPVLYVMPFDTIEEAIEMNNGVPQGLSSAIFTKNQGNMFKWIGPSGSDCGLVNVNIGTSGAEIGGAFGGEKETGGGRESGSNAWHQYMRRSTCTINYSDDLPLAQGIDFNVE